MNAPNAQQMLAATLCKVTREEYWKYCVRSQAASWDSTPMANFRDSISRKYGPAGDWDPEMAQRLSFHAHLYLAAAEQHLSGLETLLTHGHNNLPLGPAGRSVEEASGRVLWLLDFGLGVNGPDARRRVARYLLDDEENARIYNGLAYKFSHPDRAKAGDAARKAKDQVRKPGIFWASEIVLQEKPDKLVLCGQTLPGPSEFVRLAGKLLGDDPEETEGYYGYMSAMTHPTIFAFLETLADMSESTGKISYIPPSSDSQFAFKLATNATRAFYNAWRAWISWTDTGMDEANVVHQAHTNVTELADL